MQPNITQFRGHYAFLSNFYHAPFIVDAAEYATAEHAYHAAKTPHETERAWVAAAPTPGVARQRGRRITLRHNWEQMKLPVMRVILLEKFRQHPHLRARLIATGDALLREDNTWNDTYWGTCQGLGENHLGRLLMEIRRYFIAHGGRVHMHGCT